jgi:hypothetical protein
MARLAHDLMPPAGERPGFLQAAGAVAAAGCAVFALAVIVAGFVVPDYDIVADTISDLGAGRHKTIADLGLYAFSAALLACALGAAHAHLGGARWSWGAAGLALLALVVFLVGSRDAYGDGDREGTAIHGYLVYALGALFAAIPWAMARGAGVAGRGYRVALRWCAILWALAAPWFFVMPTHLDGLYERGLGLIALAFVLTLARLFWARGRRLA